MQAKDIMIKEVITIKADATVEEAAKILIEKKISGIPVVNEEEKIVGIISEGDLVFQQKKLNPPVFLNFFDGILQIKQQDFYNEIKKIAAYKVQDLMTKEVITVKPEQEISEIATLMIENNINRIPVIDSNRNILGIITRHDIIKYMY